MIVPEFPPFRGGDGWTRFAFREQDFTVERELKVTVKPLKEAFLPR